MAPHPVHAMFYSQITLKYAKKKCSRIQIEEWICLKANSRSRMRHSQPLHTHIFASFVKHVGCYNQPLHPIVWFDLFSSTTKRSWLMCSKIYPTSTRISPIWWFFFHLRTIFFFNYVISPFQIARDGDVEALRNLPNFEREELSKRVNDLDERRLTPLHYAARWQKTKQNKNRFRTKIKQTISNRYSHVEIIDLLLELGAEINQPGDDDMTPIHYAARWELKIDDILQGCHRLAKIKIQLVSSQLANLTISCELP